jgi:signal transduction histidine kinase/CheY-like chemotaxis protein
MSHQEEVFIGGSRMGAVMRAVDWSNTPVGPVESWSATLRMMVRLLLVNRLRMILWWGPTFAQFYNDSFRPVLGAKHPRSMGQAASECWAEIWHIIGPLIETPFRGGDPSWTDDLFLEIDRHGVAAETHWTLAYSPVPDDTVPGGIGGVLGTVNEITDKVVGKRRILLLRDLGARSFEAKTAQEACAIAAESFALHQADVPFALLYLLGDERRYARLAGAAGVATDWTEQMIEVDLDSEISGEQPWPLAKAVQSEELQVVEDLRRRFPSVPPGPWSDPPRSAVVCPIRSNIARQPAGLLVLGVSARLRFDGGHRGFYDLVSSQVAAAIANARAYEEARTRAEPMAEIDRAKIATRETAETANRSKDNFLSVLGHELRNPLSAIRNAITVLAYPASAPADVDALRSLIARQVSQLSHLVDDILDVSRGNAGKIRLERRPMNLADVVNRSVAALKRTGRLALHQVAVHVEPVTINGDPTRIEQMLGNLLDNALKYTPVGGRIEVSCRRDAMTAVVRVRDSGIGISAEDLPRLFEPFVQLDQALERARGGLGLGLAVVNRMVRLHGGTVMAQSEGLGRGSEFVLRIPLLVTAPPAGDARAGPMASSPSRLVLVIEDDADVRYSFSALIRLLGHRVEEAATGPEGLEKLLALRPDLALIDVGLPGLNGYALARTARQSPDGADLFLVALTGYASAEDRRRALDAGFDAHLAKPVAENALREVLARVPSR